MVVTGICDGDVGWLSWWVVCSGCVGGLLAVVELVGCLQWLSWWVACCG